MPIYEYKCQKCGKELEVMQKVTDPLLPSALNVMRREL